MSRVYFHTRNHTAEVLGSERAYLGSLVDDFGCAMIDGNALRQLRERGFLSSGSEVGARMHQLGAVDVQRVLLALRYGFGDSSGGLAYRGHPIPYFRTALNTVQRAGNDSLILAARIHAQSEIHCWVAGVNRWWLSDIISDGLDVGTFRQGQGWEGVIRLLRDRDDEPVVTSYSVCDSFPSIPDGWMDQAWPPEQHGTYDWDALTYEQQRAVSVRTDEWYELPDEERWELSLAALYARSDRDGLEMRPDDWRRFHYGEGLSFFDLLASDAETRVAKALDLPVNDTQSV